jgi:hypothetical protein
LGDFDASSTSHHDLLEIVVNVQGKAQADSDAATSLGQFLPRLFELHVKAPESSPIIDLIASGLIGTLPAFIDCSSMPRDTFGSTPLVKLITTTEARWVDRAENTLSPTDVSSLLNQEQWTQSSVNIIHGLLYRNHLPRDQIDRWFATGRWKSLDPIFSLSIVLASIDSAREGVVAAPETLSLQLDHALSVLLNHDHPRNCRGLAKRAIGRIVGVSESDVVETIARRIAKLRYQDIDSEIVSLGRQLLSSSGVKSRPAITVLITTAIQRVIRTSRMAQERQFLSDLSKCGY